MHILLDFNYVNNTWKKQYIKIRLTLGDRLCGRSFLLRSQRNWGKGDLTVYGCSESKWLPWQPQKATGHLVFGSTIFPLARRRGRNHLPWSPSLCYCYLGNLFLCGVVYTEWNLLYPGLQKLVPNTVSWKASEPFQFHKAHKSTRRRGFLSFLFTLCLSEFPSYYKEPA